MRFSAAWRGNASRPSRSSPSCALRSGLGSRDGAGDELGEGGGERRDRALRAAPHAGADQALGADEDVEPVDEVRLDPLEGRIGDLHAGQVRRDLPQLLDDSDRDGVAAHLRELVDVERRRRAAAAAAAKWARSDASSSWKYGGPMTATAAAPAPRCVFDERDRVAGRLRAAVDGDVEAPGARGEEEVGDPLALVQREEDALAGRSHGEDPVEPARGEEVGQRLERVPRRASAPPSRSGVTAAASAPLITGEPYAPDR